MDFFTALHVGGRGLSAQRVRMNAISSNLANARTTRTPQGGPYKRRDPVFMATPLSREFDRLMSSELGEQVHSVSVVGIREDNGPPRRVYDPEHPDADGDGYLELPDVNVVEEMVNMLTASRSYEANVSAIQTLKSMAMRALMLGS